MDVNRPFLKLNPQIGKFLLYDGASKGALYLGKEKLDLCKLVIRENVPKRKFQTLSQNYDQTIYQVIITHQIKAG